MNRFTNESNLTVNLSKEYLSQIPIAIRSIKEQNEIIDYVDTILAIKEFNFNTDTSTIENELDRLVYKLYDLTEKEIMVVEGNS